ncbi:MAG: 23S rRNA (guanosine(2251)-2'-O)-methyltransferase RlmB [Deltaproteobacteria bacterium]|nr:23S rRNA (guanosine(2251)-2'-O)-methyltransferase RlmB [Deltaproteobacteria bacterium]
MNPRRRSGPRKFTPRDDRSEARRGERRLEAALRNLEPGTADLPRPWARVDLDARTRSEETGVYGLHTVQALIEHQPERVLELLVDEQRASNTLASLRLDLRQRELPYRVVPRSFLDRITRDANHQGVACRVRPFVYAPLAELVECDSPALLLLDGIEDPRNLGAAARAALALGATGLVIPKDRAAAVTPAAEHVAAGALAQLPVAMVTNLARAIDDLKRLGVWTIAAEADAGVPPWQVDLTGPVALVVGGEDRGVRRLVRERCDLALAIPMAEPRLSLNAADAACALLYEMLRQRATRSAGEKER